MQQQLFRGLAASLLSLMAALECGSPTLASELRFVVPSGVEPPATLAAQRLAEYDDFTLYRSGVSEFEIWQRSAGAMPGLRVLREADRLLFDARNFDTQRDVLSPPQGWRELEVHGEAISMVQFVGPVRQEWLEAIERSGARPIHYVANNGYLVWADASARAQLSQMAAQRQMLQFSAPLPPYFKLGPVLSGRLGKGGADTLAVRIQTIRHDRQQLTADRIESLALRRVADWSPLLGFRNARFEVRLSDIQAIAEMSDVYWIELDMPRELNDEVQNQILAADFVPDQSGPVGPGYLAFLGGLGFSTSPADYPVVVIVDGGVGNGTINTGDPTLHELGDDANPTRMVFNTVCTSAASAEGVGGHGHINTSIVGGYDDRSGFPFRDPEGFQRGQGVNPYARLAGTRVFSPGFSQAACGNSDSGLIQHTWQQGARISSNSWGCSGCAGSYDDSSQAFDAGIRDADPSEPGNQQLIHLFAAGNSGSSSGTVGTPGNGKNMLTVGASENRRPSDEDGNWTDGCNIGPAGADDAMDVIGFSSRGPAPGNRIKPETIAPGTHIHGTASTSANYDGSSVCDQFRPSGQGIFAASSGTSHSTPAVAGLTSLAWWWLENAANILPGDAPSIGTPTPALLKAYLLAHPTYLTGVSANDTLPSNVQGYGMPDMSTMFDDAFKLVVNQDVLFDNSGESWELVATAADPLLPVRIMLVYTDQPGAIGTSPQVNNLDLSVDVDGQQYLGNVFSGQWSTTGGTPDDRNNYEAVFLPPGTASALTITVSAFNIAGDGVPNVGDATDQDFALVCYNCVREPTFTLRADPASAQVCTPADAVFPLQIGSVLGFVDPVTLSLSGRPSGTSAVFSVNPVIPGGSSQLTIGNTGAASPGSYDMLVTGSAAGETRDFPLALDIFTAAPDAAVPSLPVDGALNVPQQPLLEWAAAAQAGEYLVEVATDAQFADVVFSQVTSATSLVVATPLPSNAVLYWRVSSVNLCGDAVSAASSFTTVALPGDCSIGSTRESHFFDDLESGATGWTVAGSGSTWELQGAVANSGANAWHAEDVPAVSDQWLISPSVVLPAATAAHTLQFWNRQIIEDSAAGCYDGAMVEISVDDGVSWQSIPGVALLTDPWDGPIDGGFSNPAAGLDAWCGDPQDWLNSVIDISAFAGQSVRFRFRLATDSSVGREGWYIDDVLVQSCSADQVFEDGFESP